jgi:hypothetical protein
MTRLIPRAGEHLRREEERVARRGGEGREGEKLCIHNQQLIRLTRLVRWRGTAITMMKTGSNWTD